MKLPQLQKLFSGLKVYTLDIETSYNSVACWRPGPKVSIQYDAILSERKIICYSARELVTGEEYYATWDLKTQDDKVIIQDVSRLLSKADILITYNGKHFDIPWINGRALAQGLPPLPTSYLHLDLYPLIRKSCGLNSHKLDYISSLIGVGTKLSTSKRLWDDIILRKSRPALETMLDYNLQDVKLTAELFAASFDYLTLPSPLTNYLDLEKNKFLCGVCNTALERRHQKPTQSGRRDRYRCPEKACGFSYATLVPKGL